ncbi:MAG: alpha-glucosidase [Chitinophagales bacterium]|nr:alpha-glucosidase [Chitinophagales bacterium]
MEWWKKTTVYQIYPRSFFDSNGDGIGDLEGIIQKLDYIQETGFETIWISPFYASPQEDFGYDISDYLDIAPEYGTMETTHRLIQEVHKRGMRIVFDMVMNHTSHRHPWFLASKSSPTNEKKDWYIWRKGKGKNPPNNWKSMTGGSGWHYVKDRDEWYFATFLPFQPDLNYRHPAVKKAMFDIVRFWLQQGVDGFRLDIFNVIYKDAAFRDNPFSFRPFPSESNPDGFFQKNVGTVNHPDNFHFAKELRQVMDEFPERFLVGEVFGQLPVIRQYIGAQDGLHLVFIFEMLRFKFFATYFKEIIERLSTRFAAPAMPVWVFSNHDKRRNLSYLKGDVHKAAIIYFLQLTVRAVPFFYYGEEIGMENVTIPLKVGKDPIAKKYNYLPQWLVNYSGETLNRDEVRTPMQWDDSTNAGFSNGSTTWLPVEKNYPNCNVAQQQRNEKSLYNLIKKLLHLRKAHIALHAGEMSEVKAASNVLSFKRTYEQEELLVVLNFGVLQQQVFAGNSHVLCHFGHVEMKGNSIQLSGYSACILRFSKE